MHIVGALVNSGSVIDGICSEFGADQPKNLDQGMYEG